MVNQISVKYVSGLVIGMPEIVEKIIWVSLTAEFRIVKDVSNTQIQSVENVSQATGMKKVRALKNDHHSHYL